MKGNWLARAGCWVLFLLTMFLIRLVSLKLKLHPVMPDRPTPALAGHLFVLDRVGRQFPRQAFSQAAVSHGTVSHLVIFHFS